MDLPLPLDPTRASGDDEVEVVEDGVVGAGRVSESYPFESDLAADVVEDTAGVVVGVDEGDAVDTVEDRGRGCCGFCEVLDLRDGHSQRPAFILPKCVNICCGENWSRKLL